MAENTNGSRPWDRPPNSNIPNRNGDRTATPICTALGRALSAWEGVEATMANLLGVFLACEAEDVAEQNLFRYGETFKIKDRAAIIRKTTDRYFKTQRNPKHGIVNRLNSLLDQYIGWSQRRNELAHGRVTSMRAPDYSEDSQPIRTFHSLCPSHSRISQWPIVEPEFNYVAVEIKSSQASSFLSIEKLNHLQKKYLIEDLTRIHISRLLRVQSIG